MVEVKLLYLKIYYQDVRPISTSGIGTGVSFYITRESDSDYIKGIAVNRPGYGYTAGEVVTISAEDIGGSINGASNMELTLVIDATISGSGYALTFTPQVVLLLNLEVMIKTGISLLELIEHIPLLKVILYLSIMILLMSIVLMIIWVLVRYIDG